MTEDRLGPEILAGSTLIQVWIGEHAALVDQGRPRFCIHAQVFANKPRG